MILKTATEIHEFWFSKEFEINQMSNSSIWFTASKELDIEIKSLFESSIRAAGTGELNSWLETPNTCLSLVILLDQFPRNAFRGSGESFRYDPIALKSSKYGIKMGHDKALSPVERWFFYLPFMHAENTDDQNLSLKLFSQLRDEAPSELKSNFESIYEFALKHFNSVQMFGRFPARNNALGRKSTQQELEFLQENPSGF